MAELNEDLHVQVKAEIDGKELTTVQRNMIHQKYGLLEPQLTDGEQSMLKLADHLRGVGFVSESADALVKQIA